MSYWQAWGEVVAVLGGVILLVLLVLSIGAAVKEEDGGFALMALLCFILGTALLAIPLAL